MALLWFDGFDNYTGAATANAHGYVASGTTNGSGRFSGLALGVSTAASIYRSITDSTEVITGFAFQTSHTGSGNVAVGFHSSGGTAIGGLRWDGTNRRFYLTVGTATTSLATTLTTMNLSTWYYVEVRWAMSGTVQVRINGVTEMTYTGTVTNGQSSIGRVYFGQALGGSGMGTTTLYDDWYVLDTTGTTQNTFLGDCRVETVRPNANYSTQFTPNVSGAANYTMVDESGASDGDTTYVYAANSGLRDLYGIDQLSSNPATIHAVAVQHYARKSDAGTRNTQAVLQSGSATALGTSQALSASYQGFTDIWTTDPGTGGAWNRNSLEAAKIGVQVAA